MKHQRFLHVIFTCLFSTACIFTTGAVAESNIQIREFKLTAIDNGYTVSIDSIIELNPTLEEALEKGIVLYFVNKFTLVESQWYWLDEEVARIKTRTALRYHALTRRYQLNDGTSSRNYSTLKNALFGLQKLRNQPLMVSHELKPNVQYNAILRLWLDLTRMPKPFQVEALGSSAWNLSSDRLEWQMELPTPDQPFRFFGNQ